MRARRPKLREAVLTARRGLWSERAGWPVIVSWTGHDAPRGWYRATIAAPTARWSKVNVWITWHETALGGCWRTDEARF